MESNDKELRVKVKSIPTTISMNSKTKKWSGDAIVQINGKGVELLSDIDNQLDEFTHKLNNKTFKLTNNNVDEVVNLFEEITEEIDANLHAIVHYSIKLRDNKGFDNIPFLLGLFVSLERNYHKRQVLEELLED